MITIKLLITLFALSLLSIRILLLVSLFSIIKKMRVGGGGEEIIKSGLFTLVLSLQFFSPSFIEFTSCRRPSLSNVTDTGSGECRFFLHRPVCFFKCLPLPGLHPCLLSRLKVEGFPLQSLCLKDCLVPSIVSQSTFDHCSSVFCFICLTVFLFVFLPWFWTL